MLPYPSSYPIVADSSTANSTYTDASQPGYCDRSAAAIVSYVELAITLAIMTTVVPLRMYVRFWLLDALWWDDLALFLAYLCTIATWGMQFRILEMGMGTREGCYPPHNALEGVKYQFITELLSVGANIIARTSVALFVGRLFATTRRIKIGLYCWTIFMAVSLSVTAGMEFGFCRPDYALWNPYARPTASCWSETVWNFLSIFNGVVSIISDWLLALLPLYFLRKLQMSRKKKLGLAGLFALGILPGVSALARTISTMTQHFPDPFYSEAIMVAISVWEQFFLIFCPAVVVLTPLFATKKRGKHSSTLRKRGLPWFSSRSSGGSYEKDLGNSSTGSSSRWWSALVSILGSSSDSANRSGTHASR